MSVFLNLAQDEFLNFSANPAHFVIFSPFLVLLVAPLELHVIQHRIALDS